MRNFLIALRTGIGLLTLVLFSNCQPTTKTTTVYLVRHAEKDLSDPAARNPSLTPAGEERAQHLAQRLQNVPLSAVFSTSYVRTLNTVTPVAGQKNLSITRYEGHDYKGIQRLIEQQRGNTILLCGHSDNLLPIIRNAGAKPPLDSIGTNEYNNLFKLVILPDGTAQATVEKFE